ncbi:MAG: hypothetical protein OEQ13_03480 [Acidobacteriota bacterium]|nr:hypothetical protein [Acidobacteriota bacterium]
MDGNTKTGGRLTPPSIAERWFARGEELVRESRYRESLHPLEQALSCLVLQPEPPFLPTLRSCYGVALAHARNDVARGRRLCEESVYLEPDNPELYINLARVCVRAGRRELAVAAAETALALAPGHAPATRMIGEMGLRSSPVFPFLGRGNPLNKYAGIIRHRLRT